MAEQRRNITVAVTGAGGTLMAWHVLSTLNRDSRVEHVDLIVSDAGRKLMAHEFGGSEDDDPVEKLLGDGREKVTSWAPDDLAGAPTSGSYPSWGMVVVPCALGVMSRVAQGQANSLIERAADVCLKERRQLVLCVRETPFNMIHLRNMTQVTEAGGIVYPMIPTFYNAPQSVEQMYEEFTTRLLGFIGLDQTDYYAWSGGQAQAQRERSLT
ncbi:4-hydroxy-3-polyprenylbenzoate decarboxylase [Saccharopolyspora lacisalsi]|uniref:4-hydroxy-3-polyprenylbenzoate decarboxylase n=1 Tax=Halosaccharopolyspora lacisalsi TaxID=1000566 RepID=A0A839DYH5_9PSEU|nr:UbiX family flavin prenyltransferase [Halosaccharopolyspora lacisalsi]MBA8824537.1 4-hydroxy-3-polyprenylbenzoate decarboxylase [Halosaccharopolyspora lacisalsi]